MKWLDSYVLVEIHHGNLKNKGERRTFMACKINCANFQIVSTTIKNAGEGEQGGASAPLPFHSEEQGEQKCPF